jgi:hypothetical protein
MKYITFEVFLDDFSDEETVQAAKTHSSLVRGFLNGRDENEIKTKVIAKYQASNMFVHFAVESEDIEFAKELEDDLKSTFLSLDQMISDQS